MALVATHEQAGANHAPAARVRSVERVPEKRQSRATLPRALFRKQYNAVPLRDLSSLYPLAEFRTVAGDLVARWVRDYEAKGYTLITPIADVKVYGPYQTRIAGAMLTNSSGRDMRAEGYQLGEDPRPDMADVVFEAHFLIPRAFVNDHWEAENP